MNVITFWHDKISSDVYHKILEYDNPYKRQKITLFKEFSRLYEVKKLREDEKLYKINENIFLKAEKNYLAPKPNLKPLLQFATSNPDLRSIDLCKKVLQCVAVDGVPSVPELPAETRTLRAETYEDVTVNLSAGLRAALEKALDQLTDQEKYLNQLKCCIASNTLLESLLFHLPNFQLYVLLALKRGIIDGTAFTTCILFSNQYKLTNHAEIKRVRLFDKGVPNHVAWALIGQCAPKCSGQKDFDPCDGTERSQQTYLNTQQLARFRELMSYQPEFEQQFLLVPDVSTASPTVTHRLREIGYNMFMSVSTQDGPMMMVASKSMCQLYLFAQDEVAAPDLNACFLLSSDERIVEQLLTNQHDMYLDFDFFEKVQSVDGLASCPEVQGATKHDVYHAQVLLYIPLEMRVKFYHLSKLFSEIVNDCHSIPYFAATAKKLALAVGECEHRAYEEAYEAAAKIMRETGSTGDKESRELHYFLACMPRLFWKSINIQVNRIFKLSEHKETVAYCIKTFLKRLISNQERFKQLGIPVEALKELLKEKDKKDSIFISCLDEVMNEFPRFS